MFELDRFHSQALVRFGFRKLAMSLLGAAGEIRNGSSKIRQLAIYIRRIEHLHQR